MKEEIKLCPFLCKIGLHKWTKYKIDNPVDLGFLLIENWITTHKVCVRCSKIVDYRPSIEKAVNNKVNKDLKAKEILESNNVIDNDQYKKQLIKAWNTRAVK